MSGGDRGKIELERESKSHQFLYTLEEGKSFTKGTYAANYTSYFCYASLSNFTHKDVKKKCYSIIAATTTNNYIATTVVDKR